MVDVFPQTVYHEGFFYAEKMNTQQEIWKVIAECNGTYYVSSWGQVKSYKYGKERILKPGLIGNGYPAVDICTNGKRKMHRIHRLVAVAFIPNPDNKPQINHKDGDKLNNHVSNLEWMTNQENQQHGWDTGLFESKRLAIGKAHSKPVIDIATGNKYDSLKSACEDVGESYIGHRKRTQRSSKLQRFFYINGNG